MYLVGTFTDANNSTNGIWYKEDGTTAGANIVNGMLKIDQRKGNILLEYCLFNIYNPC